MAFNESLSDIRILKKCNCIFASSRRYPLWFIHIILTVLLLPVRNFFNFLMFSYSVSGRETNRTRFVFGDGESASGSVCLGKPVALTHHSGSIESAHVESMTHIGEPGHYLSNKCYLHHLNCTEHRQPTCTLTASSGPLAGLVGSVVVPPSPRTPPGSPLVAVGVVVSGAGSRK